MFLRRLPTMPDNISMRACASSINVYLCLYHCTDLSLWRRIIFCQGFCLSRMTSTFCWQACDVEQVLATVLSGRITSIFVCHLKHYKFSFSDSPQLITTHWLVSCFAWAHSMHAKPLSKRSINVGFMQSTTFRSYSLLSNWGFSMHKSYFLFFK